MSQQLRFSDRTPETHTRGVVRLFRLLILLGVWVLVGLAGLLVWGRFVG